MAIGKRGAFFNTLEELHKHWDRIDIICPKTGSNFQNPFPNVFVHPSPWPIIFQSFWILHKGNNLFRQHNHEVASVHEYPPFYNGLGAWILCHKIRLPYLLEIFHISGYPRTGSFKEWVYRMLTKLFIAYDALNATAVRVMNKYEVPEFLVRAGVPREKIKLIPAIYIDQTIFKPQEIEKKYDLIFVGRLEKNKGAGMFVRAVAELGVKAIIVGTGPLEKELKSLAQKSKANIVFHGFAKDAHEVARLVNESRVLVMCSYNEGGPRVIAEAMACGVPVVATRVGIVPSIVPKEQQCDWNSSDISTKTKLLLDDQVSYESVRRIGLETVKQFEKVSAIKFYADQLKSIANQ